MDETASEYREPESTTYDQIASLADRNVVQVDSLQRNISELQAKKEDLDREISVMQKKMLHSMKAVEDAQITKSNSESSIKQLRQDILVKRETNAKSALVISALTKEASHVPERIATTSYGAGAFFITHSTAPAPALPALRSMHEW